MGVGMASTAKPMPVRRSVTKACAPRIPSLNFGSVETLGWRMNSFSFSTGSNMGMVLVAEMPDAGEDHGDAAFVGRGDDLGIADRAAGLDGGGRARLGRRD